MPTGATQIERYGILRNSLNLVKHLENTTSTRKRGRKAEHHRTADGTYIHGLARRPSDGRWRIIGTDITFTEPDEKQAIRRFRTWQTAQKPADDKVALPVAAVDAHDSGPAVAKAARRQVRITHPPPERKARHRVARRVRR